MMHTWRTHLLPRHVTFTLCALNVGMSLLVWLFQIPMGNVIIMISVLLILWSLLFLLFGHKKFMVTFWGWITNTHAVQVMQYDHKVRYTFVRSQSDGSYVGKLNYDCQTGDLTLLPDGHVDPDCAVSFCYIWRPVDEDLATHLQLTYWDSWPSWSEWQMKSHHDMVIYRLNHVHQK